MQSILINALGEPMKLVIADDHDLFRDGLRLLLETQFPDIEILEAVDFKSALDCVSQGGVDLILTDLGMPSMDGESGVKAMLSADPAMKVVVISGHEEPDQIDQMLSLGISGYIPKSSSSDLTLNAIKLAMSGGVYLPPLLLTENSSTDEPSMPVGGDFLDGLPLTPRQKEITNLLATGKSNAVIAYELGISEGTVRIHVSAVLRALGVFNRTQVAAIVAEHRFGAA